MLQLARLREGRQVERDNLAYLQDFRDDASEVFNFLLGDASQMRSHKGQITYRILVQRRA